MFEHYRKLVAQTLFLLGCQAKAREHCDVFDRLEVEPHGCPPSHLKSIACPRGSASPSVAVTLRQHHPAANVRGV